MGYTNIFLLFMCLNFGLGIVTLADTPLSVPTTHERCYADFTESGQGGMDLIVTNSTGQYVYTAPAGSIGEDVEGIVDNIRTDSTPGTTGAAGPFDPILDFTDQSYAILNTMKNFIAGGFIADTLNHINLHCDTDPDSPTYGEPIQNEVWSYFTGGIQVIFGFLLALTLFNWLTGRSTDLGS